MTCPPSLTDFLDLLYLPRNPQVGEKTAAQYRGCCRAFDEWRNGVTLQSLSVADLSDHLRWVQDSGRSHRTVNNRRQILLTLWRWAHDEGLKESPPPTKRRLPKLREPRREPNAFTLEQMQTLKAACLDARQIPRFGPARWTGTHWWTLCSLIWDTAHRVSALLTAQRDDIDDSGFLRIRAEETKHYGDMVHQLKKSTLSWIDELPRTESGLILDWPYQKRQLWIRFERDILIPSGLPFDRKHKFHCLRRTSATHLYKATGDIYMVMRHLGHRSVQTTWGYIDRRIAEPEVTAAAVLAEI